MKKSMPVIGPKSFVLLANMAEEDFIRDTLRCWATLGYGVYKPEDAPEEPEYKPKNNAYRVSLSGVDYTTGVELSIDQLYHITVALSEMEATLKANLRKPPVIGEVSAKGYDTQMLHTLELLHTKFSQAQLNWHTKQQVDP